VTVRQITDQFVLFEGSLTKVVLTWKNVERTYPEGWLWAEVITYILGKFGKVYACSLPRFIFLRYDCSGRLAQFQESDKSFSSLNGIEHFASLQCRVLLAYNCEIKAVLNKSPLRHAKVTRLASYQTHGSYCLQKKSVERTWTDDMDIDAASSSSVRWKFSVKSFPRNSHFRILAII